MGEKFAISNFKEYKETMHSGKVTDFTNNGKCSGCGSCCTCNLYLTDKEVDIIRKYIKRHNIKPKKTIFPTVKSVIDMTCPFLDETVKENKCQIYEVRPTICKWFNCNTYKPGKFEFSDMKYLTKGRVYKDITKLFYPLE